MDQKNTFDTPTTALLHRAEYGAALLILTGLFIVHWGDIRWLPALLLFTYIDLVGYIPGAIAYYRSPDGRIPKRYYVMYNSMHSMLSMGLVVALWAWLVRPEWALLVVPIHMCIDRAVFGNQLKPFSVPFEPHRLPAFDRLLRSLTPLPASKPSVPDPAAAEPAAGSAGDELDAAEAALAATATASGSAAPASDPPETAPAGAELAAAAAAGRQEARVG
ncbi:MAG TPA: hypothetical protein VFB84_15860 [Micromonosporaceae bacterium]|nr:hypothetical protein [Micromonosporaceae bacterium]